MVLTWLLLEKHGIEGVAKGEGWNPVSHPRACGTGGLDLGGNKSITDIFVDYIFL